MQKSDKLPQILSTRNRSRENMERDEYIPHSRQPSGDSIASLRTSLQAAANTAHTFGQQNQS